MALGGRSIAEWKATISRPELLEWIAFYRSWPFDDLHRYQRPAAFIGWRTVGGSLQEQVDILSPPVIPDGMSIADFNTLRAFGADPFEEEL